MDHFEFACTKIFIHLFNTLMITKSSIYLSGTGCISDRTHQEMLRWSWLNSSSMTRVVTAVRSSTGWRTRAPLLTSSYEVEYIIVQYNNLICECHPAPSHHYCTHTQLRCNLQYLQLLCGHLNELYIIKPINLFLKNIMYVFSTVHLPYPLLLMSCTVMHYIWGSLYGLKCYLGPAPSLS
jgi:hypothetical protein